MDDAYDRLCVEIANASGFVVAMAADAQTNRYASVWMKDHKGKFDNPRQAYAKFEKDFADSGITNSDAFADLLAKGLAQTIRDGIIDPGVISEIIREAVESCNNERLTFEEYLANIILDMAVDREGSDALQDLLRKDTSKRPDKTKLRVKPSKDTSSHTKGSKKARKAGRH